MRAQVTVRGLGAVRPQVRRGAGEGPWLGEVAKERSVEAAAAGSGGGAGEEAAAEEEEEEEVQVADKAAQAGEEAGEDKLLSNPEMYKLQRSVRVRLETG